MKIQPIASPTQVVQPVSNAADLKARAIAAFSQQPPSQVVQNQNQVQPEEMKAIVPPAQRQSDSIVDQQDQVLTEEAVETAPEEVKEAAAPPPAEDPSLSKQFATLARQEKALRARAQQQEQAYKAKEAALTAREQELNSKSNQPATDMTRYISKDMFKHDPYSALIEVGMTPEEAANTLITQTPMDPRVKSTVSRLEQEIRDLKAANEQAKVSAQESQSQAYKAAVRQIETDTTNLVNSDPNFETIKATSSIRDVVDLIEKTYAEDGILLSVEEAAQQVEDYLVDEALKIAKLSKIQQRLSPVAPKTASSSAQTPAAKPEQKPQPMKTLTNATASTRQLSAKERALLAFKGELKS